MLGMGDTGMDLDSCFFRDSNLPLTSAGNWPLDSTGDFLSRFICSHISSRTVLGTKSGQ